ncbi:MAG: hypothetical protein V5A23_04785 [Halobacteriales archaeon]
MSDADGGRASEAPGPDDTGDDRHSGDGERPPDGIVVPDDADVPEWEDQYLDRVARRLVFNYDLERDVAAGGEDFDLYGQLKIESERQFLHPAINFANHQAHEHLLARRADGVTVADLEALIELGHDLADDWIDADEEHYGTDFTFVLVVPHISEEVRSFVDGFRDRTLLRYGYYGHYEVNLVVVAPQREDSVDSQEADVVQAFQTWEDLDQEPTGLLERLGEFLGI